MSRIAEAQRLTVTCGECGFIGAPLPMLFGYPTYEMAELERQGVVALGGCLVAEGDPDFVCRRCEAAIPSLAIAEAGGQL